MNIFKLCRKFNFFLLFLSAGLLMLTSCGGGDDDGGGDRGGGSSPQRRANIPGVTGPIVFVGQNSVSVTAGFQFSTSGGVKSYRIPGFSDSIIEIGPSSTGSGTTVRLSLANDELLDRDGSISRNLNLQTLPGGRSLPGVTSGKLPGTIFSVGPFCGFAVYLNSSTFGIFVPTQVRGNHSTENMPFSHNGVNVGNLSIMAPDVDGANSGFFLTVRLTPLIRKALERVATDDEYYDTLKRMGF